MREIRHKDKQNISFITVVTENYFGLFLELDYGNSKMVWSGIPLSKSFPLFVMIHTIKGSSIREINPEYSLEGLVLKLKLQFWSCDANR